MLFHSQIEKHSYFLFNAGPVRTIMSELFLL